MHLLFLNGGEPNNAVVPSCSLPPLFPQRHGGKSGFPCSYFPFFFVSYVFKSLSTLLFCSLFQSPEAGFPIYLPALIRVRLLMKSAFLFHSSLSSSSPCPENRLIYGMHSLLLLFSRALLSPLFFISFSVSFAQKSFRLRHTLFFSLLPPPDAFHPLHCTAVDFSPFYSSLLSAVLDDGLNHGIKRSPSVGPPPPSLVSPTRYRNPPPRPPPPDH